MVDNQKILFTNQLNDIHGLVKINTLFGNRTKFDEQINTNIEYPTNVKYIQSVITNLEFSLEEHFPLMIKRRDRFVNNYMREDEEKMVDKWILKTINEIYGGDKRANKNETYNDDMSASFSSFQRTAKKPDDNGNKMTNVDKFLNTILVYPTEVSMNTLNLIKNRCYVYSEYTDRNPEDSDIAWSGFNIEYGIGKNKIPVEQAVYIFAIIEGMSDYDIINDLSLNSFIEEKVFQDEMLLQWSYTADDNKNEIDNITDTLFNVYTDIVHEKLVKGIDVVYLSRMINLYIDYANVLNVIPYLKRIDNSHHECYRKYDKEELDDGSLSLLATEPTNIIVDEDNLIILQTEGYSLQAYDFKRNQKVDLQKVEFSPSSMDQFLRDELRYNELFSTFVKSIPPQKYIISEHRPDGDYEDNKHDQELQKLSNKAREHELKMISLEDKRKLRSELHETARQLADQKRQYIIEEYNNKQIERQEREHRRTFERQEKLREKNQTEPISTSRDRK